MKSALRRAAIVGPPLALFLASLLVLAASIPAWGAGVDQGLPVWMTTVSGLLFGVPGFVIGGFCARESLRRTRYGFGLHVFQLAAGYVFMLVSAVAEVALAARVADPDTYKSLEQPDGTVISADGFFFINLIVVFVFAGIVFLTSYVYSQAIAADVPTRHDRREGEPDAIGEILRRGS